VLNKWLAKRKLEDQRKKGKPQQGKLKRGGKDNGS